jgi:stage II sporulation SpoE-like protein
VAVTSAIDGISKLTSETNAPRTTPLGPIVSQLRSKRLRPTSIPGADDGSKPESASSATNRQKAQLPAFAPLLEELEVAGWSSHRRMLSGNFHDWFIVDGQTLLVMVGQAVALDSNQSNDAIEAALVAQGAWASIRSHAHHAGDAGELLSLAAGSLWSNMSTGMQAAAVVALADLEGGHASVAMAGDGLAFRIRAAGAEQLGTPQPTLGSDPSFSYVSHSLQLSLRERLVLMVDEPAKRPAKLATKIVSCFAQIDAESHRRMLAADAISLTRDCSDPPAADTRPTMSLAAIRRR